MYVCHLVTLKANPKSFLPQLSYLWFAGNDEMEKEMETQGLGVRTNGKENGNYSNGLYRHCSSDP